jgi:hypothetical protein
MWKLFFSVLAMSDTGSVSTTAIVTEYPSAITCQTAVRSIAGPPVTKELNGHRVVIQTFGVCKNALEGERHQTQSPPPEYDLPYPPRGYRGPPMPPPIQGMIEGFIGGMLTQPPY